MIDVINDYVARFCFCNEHDDHRDCDDDCIGCDGLLYFFNKDRTMWYDK